MNKRNTILSTAIFSLLSLNVFAFEKVDVVKTGEILNKQIEESAKKMVKQAQLSLPEKQKKSLEETKKKKAAFNERWAGKKVIRKYSYYESKKLVNSNIKDSHTFFSNCKIWPGYHPRPNLNSCDLENDFEGIRLKFAQRIEIDHIIPASMLKNIETGLRSCAKNAISQGKKYHKICMKKDDQYKKAYSDMVNLVPDLKLIFSEKKGKDYGMVIKLKEIYGKTGIYLGKKYFQPPQSKAGDVARIAFYMNWKYNVKFTDEMVKTFLEWNEYDPISPEEIERNKKILKTQGWANPYVQPELLEDN